MDLKLEKCKPCEGGIEPLTIHKIALFVKQLDSSWKVIDNHHLTKEFAFVNFKHTMSFVNKIAELAESEGHHADLHISYAKLKVKIWTHAIDGLSENDFILASKIDSI